MAELWDVYDENRRKTGLLHERGTGRMQDGQYHLVVQVWVVNRAGEYLMSKRHLDKLFPLFWESTGGSVLSGETSLQGALREVEEELGLCLDAKNGRLIKSVRRERFHDYYDVWLFHSDAQIRDLVLQGSEVIDAKWMTEDEICALFESENLHPALDYYLEVFAAYNGV